MAWIDFEYRDFWEVPRLIVFTVGAAEYMLDSEYDEATGSYAAEYKLYRMPPIPDPHAPAPEVEEERRLLGSIPVAELAFDETRRQRFDDAPLRALMRR